MFDRLDGPPLPSESELESDSSEYLVEDWIELADLAKDPKPVAQERAVAEQAVSARVSVVVSVISPVLRGEPHTIPHLVYADLVRESDMMYG